MPVFFVPKKGGTFELYVDCRALNRHTRKDRAALSLIGEILDRLSIVAIYTQLDLRNAFVEYTDLNNRERSGAFHFYQPSTYQLRSAGYEWKLLSAPVSDILGHALRLTKAPATFSRHYRIVYLNDILVYSEDRATYEQHVHRVLKQLH